jgi:hypothetical protein
MDLTRRTEKALRLTDVIALLERNIAMRREFRTYYDRDVGELGVNHPTYRQKCERASEEFSKEVVLGDLLMELGKLEIVEI